MVTFNDVKPYLPDPIVKALSGSEEKDARFVEAEIAAVQILTDETGINPETEVAPNWALLPLAWIIAKIGAAGISSQTADFRADMNANFDKALLLLRRHKQKPDATGNSLASNFEIERRIRW